jgi:serine/threonine protein kinase
VTGGGGVSSQPVDIPGYRIEGLLGRGGMGTVYRATDLRLGRTVAVKVLNPERAIDPDFRARFVDESRRAASIEHPNVLPVYEAGEAGGVLYIAMRLIEGSDLRELIAREGALDPERAARIVGQAAAGLDAAHARRLVHRDVKPANILMARPGRPDEHAYPSTCSPRHCSGAM